jgi:hypothetical protein
MAAPKGNNYGKKWQKGQSGNPRGRPKKDFKAQDLVANITNDGEEIVRVIHEIMNTEQQFDPRGNPIVDPTAQIRLAAARALGERLWGAPPKSDQLKLVGDPEQPIETKHEVRLILPD